MSDEQPKTVRVEIEFANGRIISLHGDDAEKWSQLVSGMSVLHAVHGGDQEPLPWKETFTSTANVKAS